MRQSYSSAPGSSLPPPRFSRRSARLVRYTHSARLKNAGATGRRPRACTSRRCRPRGVDAFTFLSAQLQLSATKSYAGDHYAALADLQRLGPLVSLVARRHVHLWPLYCNDLAYELGLVGRIDEARAASAVAVASPVAAAYPEWRETAEEIAERQSSKAIIVVAIPEDAPGELETHRRTPIYGVPFTRVRLPLAPSALITAHLETCAPIHGPPFHF